jgi:siroheme synthase (precorrin-2 oxidase/ferrochelatase)
MLRKLTITLDEQVYEGLYRKVGRRRISRFLEGLARPHVVDEDLARAYKAMAADEEREAEAQEWVENQAADTPHEEG